MQLDQLEKLRSQQDLQANGSDAHCAAHLGHSLCVPFDLVGEVAYQTIPCSRVKIASINMSTQVWSFIFGHLCEIDMRRDICMYD